MAGGQPETDRGSGRVRPAVRGKDPSTTDNQLSVARPGRRQGRPTTGRDAAGEEAPIREDGRRGRGPGTAGDPTAESRGKTGQEQSSASPEHVAERAPADRTRESAATGPGEERSVSGGTASKSARDRSNRIVSVVAEAAKHLTEQDDLIEYAALDRTELPKWIAELEGSTSPAGALHTPATRGTPVDSDDGLREGLSMRPTGSTRPAPSRNADTRSPPTRSSARCTRA